MRIILLGCPGAGKGTQAAFIAHRYNIPLIATGDMLRAAVTAKSPLGEAVKQIMEQGALVPDQIITEVVKERIAQNDCIGGFLLDGFPRTIPQAKALHKAGIAIDLVIEIAVPDEEIVQRLSGRWIHVASGRVYHERYNPPLVAGCDDVTGAPLSQRSDDDRATILERLKVYHAVTEPLVDYYNTIAQQESETQSTSQSATPRKNTVRCTRIDGLGTVEEVQARIVAALNGNKQC